MAGNIKDKIIVRRYAEAFINTAKGYIGIERIVRELKDFKILLRENPQLETFLNTYEITKNEKSAVLEKVLPKEFSREFKDFLNLLIEKRRIDKIIDVADYVRSSYAHDKEVDALLRCTYPLDLTVIEKIKRSLENKLNKKFNLYLEIDPDLLGCVQVIIGNTIIDGSIKKRLLDLKQQLISARVV